MLNHVFDLIREDRKWIFRRGKNSIKLNDNKNTRRKSAHSKTTNRRRKLVVALPRQDRFRNQKSASRQSSNYGSARSTRDESISEEKK